MIDFATVSEFSRNNCIAICSFLVPANLLATLQTLLFVWLERPLSQLRLSAILASTFAILIIFHVFSWFLVGVVMPPTFILIALGCVCLVINFFAVAYSPAFSRLLKSLVNKGALFTVQKAQKVRILGRQG